ncbi:MAG: hypothetical protein ACRDZO_24810 [Egibacteraceae bacterium]
MVPGFCWTAAAAIYGLAVAGAVVVLFAPYDLRRSVAFAVTDLVSTVLLTGLAVPIMLIKLLLRHLLPEEESS